MQFVPGACGHAVRLAATLKAPACGSVSLAANQPPHRSLSDSCNSAACPAASLQCTRICPWWFPATVDLIRR
jgi:hypothetical protein